MFEKRGGVDKASRPLLGDINIRSTKFRGSREKKREREKERRWSHFEG